MNGPSRSWPRSEIWIAAGIALLAVVVFAPALRVGFMLDDNFQVLRNAAVLDFDVSAIFGQGYWENVGGGYRSEPGSDLYRPLSTLSVAVSFALWGEDPRGYHAENVLLHALAAALAFGLLRRWGLGRAVAVLAALLFAVAPVHIEPVGSVVLRNEILAAIAGILFLRGMAAGRAVVPALLLFAALLAKESAIALPVVAVVASHVFGRDRGGPGGVRASQYLPTAAVVVAYLGLRYAVLGQLTLAPAAAYFGPDVSWPVVWLTMARYAVEHYLGAALVGVPLVFDFSPESFRHAATDDAVAWCCAAGWLLAGAAASWYALRRRCAAAAGVVVFMLLLGPTANVVTRIGVLGASRLLYLPYLGLALALVLAARAAWSGLRLPRGIALPTALAGLVVLALSVQTERRFAVWRHELLFYGDLVEQVPRNALALGFLGQREFDVAYPQWVSGTRTVDLADVPELSGHNVEWWFDRAFTHLRRSIAVRPRNWPGLIRPLARSAVLLGREAELQSVLENALPAGAARAPTAAEWAPLDAELRAAGFAALRGAAPPPAVLQRLDDPRFARALAAELVVVLPDVARARPALQPIARAARSELDPAAKRALRTEVDEVMAALTRVRDRCRVLTAAPAADDPPSRQIVQGLAADLFGRDYLDLCRTRLRELRALRERL